MGKVKVFRGVTTLHISPKNFLMGWMEEVEELKDVVVVACRKDGNIAVGTTYDNLQDPAWDLERAIRHLHKLADEEEVDNEN